MAKKINRVCVGCRVRIFDAEGQEDIFLIVPFGETNIKREGILVETSPLARVLIGATVGQNVKVTQNGKIRTYKVDAILGIEEKYKSYSLAEKTKSQQKTIANQEVNNIIRTLKKKYNVNISNSVSMSESKIEALINEMRDLKINGRKDVARKIKEAREKGNLGNSPEFDAAKLQQRDMEKRIKELEYQIAAAQIKTEDMDVTEAVYVGSIVILYDEAYDEYLKYNIVPSEDANSMEGKISEDAPLGKALIGTKVGDRVKVKINEYTSCYKVDAIVDFDNKYKDRLFQDKKRLKQKKSDINKPNKKETKDITAKHFLTRVNVFRCTGEEHTLIDIWCKVAVLKRDGAIEECLIPGAYCKECNKYFILESQYEKIKQKGVLICKVVENDYWSNNSQYKKGYAGMNSESVLHMMGYNVNVQADLTKQQRWGILEIAVDNNILSAMEICSHLQWLINRSSNLKNFADARDKWNADLRHITNYASIEREQIKASGITVNRKHV